MKGAFQNGDILERAEKWTNPKVLKNEKDERDGSKPKKLP
jgi:hypothetical protein